jgi:hypothetical protein
MSDKHNLRPLVTFINHHHHYTRQLIQTAQVSVGKSVKLANNHCGILRDLALAYTVEVVAKHVGVRADLH